MHTSFQPLLPLQREIEVDEFTFHYTMSEKPHIQNDTITSECENWVVPGNVGKGLGAQQGERATHRSCLHGLLRHVDFASCLMTVLLPVPFGLHSQVVTPVLNPPLRIAPSILLSLSAFVAGLLPFRQSLLLQLSSLPCPAVVNYRLASDHLIKLSISHALAQSTKLSVYEQRVMEIVESTKDLPEILATTGKVGVCSCVGAWGLDSRGGSPRWGGQGRGARNRLGGAVEHG